jgi:hypothetical protein
VEKLNKRTTLSKHGLLRIRRNHYQGTSLPECPAVDIINFAWCSTRILEGFIGSAITSACETVLLAKVCLRIPETRGPLKMLPLSEDDWGRFVRFRRPMTFCPILQFQSHLRQQYQP